MVGKPTQLGCRDRRNGHHTDAFSPFLCTQLGHEVCGGLGGPGVVPQQRIPHHYASAVQAYHAVLLGTDGHRRDIVQAACGGAGGLQGRPPQLRIDLGAVGMR